MIILDTDHFSELRDPDKPHFDVLTQRFVVSGDEQVATTIVTVEAALRGWLAIIHQTPDFSRQIPRYRDLHYLCEFLGYWEIVPFDADAVTELVKLRSARGRTG